MATFEILSPGSVSITLSDSFKILVGTHPVLENFHLVLTSKVTDIDSILYSGVKVGMTWPAFKSLSPQEQNQLKPVCHIFQSFSQPWELPCGWTVYPVSAGIGIGRANWLFTNGDKSVLVVGDTCIDQDACIYKPAWAVSETSVESKVDYLFYTTSASPLQFSLEDAKLTLEHQSPVSIRLDQPAEIVAVLINLAHHVSTLPNPTPIAVYGDELIKSIYELPAMFEWLSEDLQTYLLKCANFITEQNHPVSEPVVLVDLIQAGRVLLVKIGRTVADRVKTVVSLTSHPWNSGIHLHGTSLLKLATPAELCKWYNVVNTVSTHLVISTFDVPQASVTSKRGNLATLLTQRYKTVTTDSNGITTHTIPTSVIQISSENKLLSILTVEEDTDLTDLIHIVS